ncbi:hypothetical protein D3C86_1439830 [compost metagenome]
MNRFFALSSLFALAACAGSGLIAGKAQGQPPGIRSIEVTGKSVIDLRTSAILEASQQCRAESKRVRIVEVNRAGLTLFSHKPLAEAVFRCE